MTTFGYILWGLIIILVVLPPKYDPAIRWKERNERHRASAGRPE